MGFDKKIGHYEEYVNWCRFQSFNDEVISLRIPMNEFREIAASSLIEAVVLVLYSSQ